VAAERFSNDLPQISRPKTVSAPLLEAKDLVVAYGNVVAVQGITFEVGAGMVVSLVGSNGAGKSSTLAALAGLLRPRAGRIRFAGEDVTGMAPHALVSRGLVLVPEGRQILGQMTVAENLALGAYQRRDRAAVRRDMEREYERFPILAQRRNLPAGSLSGGEQQALALARGLLARPRLLLLDEPSMGLAPLLVNEVFRTLSAIHADGATLLLVEQNARKALTLSDHAYVLQTGRIAVEGSGAELLQDPAVEAAYLGTGTGTGDVLR
jgi:branched-chain amino acid transport system ATP-binding protein